MIRISKETDIPALKKLWKDCFGDEERYIDDFFAAMYREADVLAEEGETLRGASFFLPGKIYQNGAWRDIRYVYALATDARYRGRGIAGGLLRYAKGHYGAPLIAEPADAGLADGFYAPLSFVKSFYLSEYCVDVPQYSLRAAQIAQKILPADAEAYCRIRNERLLCEGYVAWPSAHVAFAVAEHEKNGGGALRISDGDGMREDALLYYLDQKTAVVTETTLSAEETVDVLFPYLPQETAQLRIYKSCAAPRGSEPEKRRLMGMSLRCGAAIKAGYLNLTLD